MHHNVPYTVRWVANLLINSSSPEQLILVMLDDCHAQACRMGVLPAIALTLARESRENSTIGISHGFKLDSGGIVNFLALLIQVAVNSSPESPEHLRDAALLLRLCMRAWDSKTLQGPNWQDCLFWWLTLRVIKIIKLEATDIHLIRFSTFFYSVS